MASLGDYLGIRAELKRVTNLAFGIDEDKVQFGEPRLPKDTNGLPYACWQLQPVAMSFSGPTGTVRSLNQDYVWRGFFAFRKPEPQESDEESHKVLMFGTIALLLEANELFAEVGMLPHTSQFDPTEWMPPLEGAHGFSLEFSTLVNRTWGT